MKKYIASIAAVTTAAVLLLVVVSYTIVAQSTLTVEGFLADVWDSVNNSMNISIVSTDTNQEVGGNLTVDGTMLFFKDNDLNAGTNNVTIYPNADGSDTIEETTSAVFDADGDAAWFLYDADNTNWSVMGDF